MGEREGGRAAGPENAWRRRREHLARWCRRFCGMIFLWAARGVVREADFGDFADAWVLETRM